MSIVVLSRHALKNSVHAWESNQARHMELQRSYPMTKVVYILLDDINDSDVSDVTCGAPKLRYPQNCDERLEFYDKLRYVIYKALKT